MRLFDSSGYKSKSHLILFLHTATITHLYTYNLLLNYLYASTSSVVTPRVIKTYFLSCLYASTRAVATERVIAAVICQPLLFMKRTLA